MCTAASVRSAVSNKAARHLDRLRETVESSASEHVELLIERRWACGAQDECPARVDAEANPA